MREVGLTASNLITEKQLQSTVLGWAKAYGWLAYHQLDTGGRDTNGNVYYSRRIGPGFPDLVLCHPVWGKLIFAELKTDKGKVSENQQEWLEALRKTKTAVYVWRPRDMPEIEQILQRS